LSRPITPLSAIATTAVGGDFKRPQTAMGARMAGSYS